MRLYLFYTLCLVYGISFSQTIKTQSIRGQVLDAFSHSSIPGALVEVTTTTPTIKTITDLDGYFRIDSVTLGRHSVQVSSMGYAAGNKTNILVTQGKQPELIFELEEELIETEVVVIEGHKDKSTTINENISVSGRTFSIEETKRYAASKNDPARMAQNFAGVATSADDRNDIIVRGNSPIGVQYRLDGIVVPNPNHFGTLGTSGGPISILNNNNLSNSDFLTGAFPAEYGNALAGIFDLRLKTGNHEKREYLGQVGFNGFELGAEGPFKKGSKSSYIANYRYSTLGVFQSMGISFGTVALPEYQDGTFKLHFKTKNSGTFSVFGMGGLSHIDLLGSELDADDLFGDRSEDVRFKSKMATTGMNHLYFFKDDVSLNSFLSYSHSSTKVTVDKLTYDLSDNIIDERLDYYNNFLQSTYTLGTRLKKKFTPKANMTLGVQSSIYNINFVDSSFIESINDFEILRNFTGTLSLQEVYGMFQFKHSKRLTSNYGLHIQHLSLNNSVSIEPRIGFKYQLSPTKTLSFGTGLHSQTQALQIYYLETVDDNGDLLGRTNEDLGFTRSLHAVIGFDNAFKKNWRYKIETYYQHVFDAPVLANDPTFSMLNVGGNFEFPSVDSLFNGGIGRNYGIEFTLERFFSNDYYVLSTVSLYNSEYQGTEGKWRNTSFNGNYTYNILGGKEFKVGQHNAIEIDGKFTYAGGRRYTPIDLVNSLLTQEIQFQKAFTNEQKFDPNWRFDIRIGFRKEGKKATQEWAFDIQNVTNRKNIFLQDFDPATGQVNTKYQIGIFPVAQYRITF